MRVTSTHDARRFVRERGGTLYVTLPTAWTAAATCSSATARLVMPDALHVSVAAFRELAVEAVDRGGAVVWRAGTDSVQAV